MKMVEAFKTLVTFDAFVFSILTMGQFVFGQRTFIGEYFVTIGMRAEMSIHLRMARKIV